MISDMLRVVRLLEQMESNLQMRGTRGYGASHPYAHGYRRVYGKSEYSDDYDDEDENNAKQEPVKVSRAFANKETVKSV